MTHSPAPPTPALAASVPGRGGLRAQAPVAARRMLALTTVLALAATLLVVTGQPARAAGFSSTDASQFHQLVNGERDRLGRLATHTEITGIAQDHSRTMARNSGGECSLDTIYHRNPISKGIKAPWTLLAENVGCYRNQDMSDSQRVEKLHQALMNSEGHKKNILKPDARYVGIGVFRDDDNGIWVTQIFMDMQESTAPAPKPKPAPTTSKTTSDSSSRTQAQATPRPETRRAQQRLAALGFYTGAVDGLFGPGTTRAVRAFQTAAGLTVDGILGPRTSQALYADDAPRKGESKAQPKPEPKPQPKAEPKNEATPVPAEAGPSRAVPPLGPEHLPGGLGMVVASTGMIGSVTDVPAAMDRVRGLLALLTSALRSLGA